MQGFSDVQLDTLIKLLSLGRIWSCNVGENFLVSGDGWRKFHKSTSDTSLAFTYVSEAHLQRMADLKILMRAAIRLNRILSPRREPDVCKHISNMWCDPLITYVRLLSSAASASPSHRWILQWRAGIQTFLHVLAYKASPYCLLVLIVQSQLCKWRLMCWLGRCTSVTKHYDNSLPAGSTPQAPLHGGTMAVPPSPSTITAPPTQRLLQK